MNFEQLWTAFGQQEKLSDTQLSQFQTYYTMVCSANELFNLTAITELKPALAYHFRDSLALGHARDLQQISWIADVGTGAGFPAIPLKIKYPHLKMVLIEVTHKKIQFLEEVARTLAFSEFHFEAIDWRTFLRKTEYPLELVCARASLQPEELLRMLKPSSPYKNAQLVYWASQQWQPNEKEAPFVKEQYSYKVGNKNRTLIFFNNN